MLNKYKLQISLSNSNVIYLKALKKNKKYLITNMDSGLRIVRSGEDLMKIGLLVDLPQQPDSVILKINSK